MADINLDDLLKAKEREFNTQTAQIQPVEPQTEIAKVTQQTEMISPEDRRRIDEIKMRLI